METTPIPINQPKVITSMMGSVFGSPMKGVELVPPSNPTTPVNPVVKPPLDVLTQEVATLQSLIKTMKSEMDQMRREINAMNEPLIVHAPSMPFSDTPNPLAPEKKKPGRLKKVD